MIKCNQKKKERYNSDNIFNNKKKEIILDGTEQEQKLDLIEINNIKWLYKSMEIYNEIF